MPPTDPESLETLRLYQRCKERNALPCAGGVWDQPEAIMRQFDVVDEVVATIKKQQAEQQERDAELARLRNERHGGH